MQPQDRSRTPVFVTLSRIARAVFSALAEFSALHRARIDRAQSTVDTEIVTTIVET
jgi:hypothetical protein